MAVTLPTYDTKVSRLALSPNQQGEAFNVFDINRTWTEGDFPLAVHRFQSVAVSFDFSVTNDPVRGLTLAPRRPFTSVTGDLAGTGESDNYWQLKLGTDETSIPNFDWMVMMTISADPDPFSLTNLPFVFQNSSSGNGVSNVVPAWYLLREIGPSSSEWVQKIFSPYSIVIDIDFESTLIALQSNSNVLNLIGDDTPNAVNRIPNDGAWNGLVQFAIRLVTQDNVVRLNVTSASFAGLTHPWHTGQMGLDVRRRARVVHDYITGTPYLSDEAIADPWRDGVMVNSANSDPDEIRKHHSYVPPLTEGVVDDDIPKVE